MQKKRIFTLFLCSFVLQLLVATCLWAEAIVLSDLGVSNADGKVAVGFSIDVMDAALVLAAMQNGGEYEVRCTGSLYHRRAGIWDELLAENAYTCKLSSRPVAREFRVKDSRGARVFSFQTLQKDLNRFWFHLSLPLGSWDMIERTNTYRVVLKFSVVRTNISDWVSKPLFFVNWDLIPETEYVLDFDF